MCSETTEIKYHTVSKGLNIFKERNIYNMNKMVHIKGLYFDAGYPTI